MVWLPGSSIVTNSVALGGIDRITGSIGFAGSTEVVGGAVLVLGLVVVASLI